MQSVPMLPFQHQITVHGKIELILSDRITTSCPSSYFLHIPHLSWFLWHLFFRQWPVEFLQWNILLGSLSSSLCSFLCVGALQCTFAGLCSQDPCFFSELLQECWKPCPSYTSCIWKQVPGSRVPTHPVACQEMWMDSVDYQEIFYRSPDQETGKYVMNHHWFMILASFFPWKIFSQL